MSENIVWFLSGAFFTAFVCYIIALVLWMRSARQVIRGGVTVDEMRKQIEDYRRGE